MTNKTAKEMSKETEKAENSSLYEDEFKIYEDSDEEFEFRAYRNKCKENGTMKREKTQEEKNNYYNQLTRRQAIEREIEDAYFDEMAFAEVHEDTVREYYDYCRDNLNGRDLQGEDVSQLDFRSFFEIYHEGEKFRIFEEFCRVNPGVSRNLYFD